MPLQIVRRDITQMCVDAIVNTTNEEMIACGGVDLAVHTAAGNGLAAECAKIAPLGLGQAKITGAYRLPCRYVIHTSGPVWHGGLLGESILLRSCYIESLKLAVQYKCGSVAVPLISSGGYGYPKDQVLRFAVQTVSEFLEDHELNVYICVFDKDSYTFSRELYRDILDYIAEPAEDTFFDVMCDARSDNSKRISIWAEKAECSTAAPSPLTGKARKTTAENLSLHAYVKQMDRSFQEMLFDLIDESGMTDVECYKRANVDKRTFSKIKSGGSYRPSKQTAIAFAISLQLDLDTTQELLATLGFTLSRSNVFDKIIRYFIHQENYNIFEINEALFEFDQVLLGSV